MAKRFIPTKTKDVRKAEIDSLLDTLEAGMKSFRQNFKVYLSMFSRFPSYSINNIILIFMQCPYASNLQTFNAWRKLGRKVRRGQKAIKILAPICGKEEDEITGDEVVIIKGFRTVALFDVSQTEGAELPQSPIKLLTGSTQAAEHILKATQYIAELNDIDFSFGYTGEANGYYVPEERAIVVSDENALDQQAKTAVHELVHAELHHERDASREEEEVVAESVAFIVCSMLGLDTSDYSFGYVLSWSKDDTAIKRFANTIQVQARKMIETYEDIICEILPQYTIKENDTNELVIA